MAGRIQIRIEANAEGLKKGLDDGDKRVRSFQKQMVSAGKVAGVALAAVGTAAVATAGALAAIVKSTANAGDQFAKMGRQLGISTEDLSALGHVADLAGASVEDLQTGIRALSKRMFDASQGLAEAKRSFEELDVKIENTDGSLRPLKDVLFDIADRFAGMTDATKRAALAQEFFSRGGLKMITVMEGGSKNVQALMGEAKRLGIVFSTEAALAAEAFNDNLTRVGKALDGVKFAVGNRLIPILDDLAVKLVTFVQTDEFRNWVRDVADAIAVLLPRAIGFAIQTFRLLSIATNAASIGLLVVSNAILAVALAVFQGGKEIRDLLGIKESLGVTTEQVAEKITQLSASILENRETMRFLKDDILASAQAFQNFSGLALPAIERVKPALKIVQEGVKKLKDEIIVSTIQARSFSDVLRGIGEEALTVSTSVEPSVIIMQRLREELERNQLRADLLGKGFDKLGADLAANQRAFEQLVTDGAVPLNENLKRLGETIQGLESLKIGTFWQQQLEAIRASAATTWSSIQQSFSSAVAGIIQGTATMKEFFQSVLNTMIQAVINLVVQMIANWALATLFQSQQNQAQLAVHTAAESAKTVITGAQETARLGIILATNKVMVGATIATLAAIGAVGAAAMAVMGAVVAATAAVLTAIGAALAASVVGAPLAPAFFAAAALVGTAGSAAVAAGTAAIAGAIAAATAAATAALAIPLKHGGIVTGETFARLGEAGPEAVIPLDRLAAAGGGEIHLNVILDERTLLSALVPNIPGFVRVRAGIRTA